MDIKKLEIVDTLDNSGTLYVPELDEHYHSVNGAIQESLHVFIVAGFDLVASLKSNIRILEVGFGTGLNALLTIKQSLHRKCDIEYIGLEKYPLPMDIVEKLNYTSGTNKSLLALFKKLHSSPWNSSSEIIKGFKLFKSECNVLEGINFNHIDLVYFDAFAPDKQPEMWAVDVFESLYQQMNDGGVMVTYCAKGEVRRRMQAVGFKVERLAGPLGKREMLRAIK